MCALRLEKWLEYAVFKNRKSVCKTFIPGSIPGGASKGKTPIFRIDKRKVGVLFLFLRKSEIVKNRHFLCGKVWEIHRLCGKVWEQKSRLLRAALCF